LGLYRSCRLLAVQDLIDVLRDIRLARRTRFEIPEEIIRVNTTWGFLSVNNPPHDPSSGLSTGDSPLFFECAQLPTRSLSGTIERFSNIPRGDYRSIDSLENAENVVERDCPSVPASVFALTGHV
jgi:hypothetical protein